VLRLGGYWQRDRNSLTVKAALDFALDVKGNSAIGNVNGLLLLA
jgi:hypothetical protein